MYRITVEQWNPRGVYSEVSPIDFNGIYFQEIVFMIAAFSNIIINITPNSHRPFFPTCKQSWPILSHIQAWDCMYLWNWVYEYREQITAILMSWNISPYEWVLAWDQWPLLKRFYAVRVSKLNKIYSPWNVNVSEVVEKWI